MSPPGVRPIPHASTRGRVRASGHRGGGDRAPLRARRGTCPRRGPDAAQRDEGTGRLARRARRPGRSGRAADDLVLRRRERSRARRDGHEHAGDRVVEVEVARPILAEVAATIADVQIRNRGTVGGNVCVNDPTNHFPPLLAALGASFTIRGADGERVVSADEFFVGVYLTAVGEGELLTKISVPTRKPGTGDAMEGVTLGAHGTYIANAAATVGPDGHPGRRRLRRRRSRCARRRWSSGSPDGDLSEASVRAAAEGLGASLDPPVRRPRERGLSSPPGRGLGRAGGPPGRRESERMSVPIDQPDDHRRVNGKTVRARRRRVDAARPLPARRARPDGHPRRLRHRQLRRLHRALDGDAVKSCCLLAVQVDGA